MCTCLSISILLYVVLVFFFFLLLIKAVRDILTDNAVLSATKDTLRSFKCELYLVTSKAAFSALSSRI
jgi:hypothetical protein